MDFDALRQGWAGPGRIEWIGVRPARRQPVEALERTHIAASGLRGDRRRSPGKRAVTLFQWEHLPVIAALAGKAHVPPELLRRNLGISGFPLLALRGRHFRIGEAVLFGTGICGPCSRMEEALGEGGYNAVRGHGGITAEVVLAGDVACGDALVPLTEEEGEAPGSGL